MPLSSSHKYLSCSIYYSDNLSKCFPHLQQNALVVIATLLGNDFLSKKDIWEFFAKIQSTPSLNDLPLNFNPEHPEIMRLMNWIAQKENLHCAMEEVISCLRKNTERIRESISKSIDWYGDLQNHAQPLIEYFQGIQKYHQEMSVPAVPEWLEKLYQRGEISIVIPRLITVPRNVFFSQVEDLESPSSFECATSIRQVVYGILTHTSSSGRSRGIEEIYRDKRSVKSVFVDPARSTPSLLDIPLLDKHRRKLITLDALENSSCPKVDLPADAEFFTAIIRYCLEKSKPKLNEKHVYALLCCFLIMNMKFESLLHQANGKSTTQDTKLTLSSQAFENIETKCRDLCHHGFREYNIHVIHAFAQFQACFLAALDLNQTLLCPFPNLNPARAIHGTFLHNLFIKLEASTVPKSITEDLFEGSQCFLEMFRKMECAVLTLT